MAQHSYGKLHIYLWITYSWFQMVYLIAMVVTLNMAEKTSIRWKQEPGCEETKVMMMSLHLFTCHDQWPFATCYIISVFQLQGNKMSIKLNESQHVQRYFSGAKTPLGCGASWQKIYCRWEFQQAVAVAVPSDIQTLHLTTPRVSPNTPDRRRRGNMTKFSLLWLLFTRNSLLQPWVWLVQSPKLQHVWIVNPQSNSI